jgi:hypothetical protein
VSVYVCNAMSVSTVVWFMHALVLPPSLTQAAEARASAKKEAKEAAAKAEQADEDAIEVAASPPTLAHTRHSEKLSNEVYPWNMCMYVGVYMQV